MRSLAVLILAVCVAPACLAADFNPFEGPRPILVFIQSNPWLMAIGSDIPSVAAYETGEMIFTKKTGDRLVYHHVTLEKDGLSKVLTQLRPVLELKNLKPAYNIAPDITDQPEAMFYMNDRRREIATTVYGLMVAGTRIPGSTRFPDDTSRLFPRQNCSDFISGSAS